jgi:hypothetical protein
MYVSELHSGQISMEQCLVESRIQNKGVSLCSEVASGANAMAQLFLNETAARGSL